MIILYNFPKISSDNREGGIKGQGFISFSCLGIINKEEIDVNKMDFDKQVWICLSKANQIVLVIINE